jgi:hypothetical protein
VRRDRLGELEFVFPKLMRRVVIKREFPD